MPVIVFSSPKGGAGKTTSATILTTELTGTGASVTVVDADPNRNVTDWARLPGVPDNLTIISEASEESIVDCIAEASSKSAFVVVDLEGAASLLVSYAISMADLVIIPVQGSQLDAKQAARQIKLIRAQERIAKRTIPFVVLFTRTNPAITPRTQRHIERRLVDLNVPVLHTRLYDREAFRALFSYGGTLAGLRDKSVSNLDAAIRNARAFASEVLSLMRGQSTPPAEAATAIKDVA